MDDSRVLVTGGAGFIGSNLANYLAADNEVVALDDTSIGTADHLREDVEFVEASVLEEDAVAEVADVDVLVHLAAMSSRAMHEDDPAEGARVNVEGMISTVEAVRERGCDTVVYASTSSLYDDHPPARESDRVTSDTAYTASMLARERYAQFYDDMYDDLAIAGTRFFSVYQGFAGAESHKGEYANTVSQWAAKMADGERPVLFGDGEQTRDYVHVDDVVRGIEAIADSRLSGVYNVGTGRNFSFNETVALLNEALGTEIEPAYEPMPFENYNYRQRADPSKLQRATGWTPRVSFEEGVQRVCEPYVSGDAAATAGWSASD